jgi:hypothetical protein
MLIEGGAVVTTIVFRRSREPVTSIQGTTVIDLGRTVDGMPRRALSVAQALGCICSKARRAAGQWRHSLCFAALPCSDRNA